MSDAKPLTVAAAQFESALGDLDANLERHLAAIDAARAQGVGVLLFPELSLTGHNAGPEVLRLALPRDDPRITRLARASGPMCTVFGFIEEGFAAQVYNSCGAVQDGGLVFLHRKINLATYGQLEEGKHFAQGRYVETFPVAPYWQASILICADAWNPALVHLAALHGSTLLLIPISSAREAVGVEFDNPSGWEINLRFYATTYGLPVVMANRVGRERGLSFWGGSCVVDPFGAFLARANDETEELIAAELDYARLRRARYLLPTVRDSNLDLIHREVNRLAEVIGVPSGMRKL